MLIALASCSCGPTIIDIDVFGAIHCVLILFVVLMVRCGPVRPCCKDFLYLPFLFVISVDYVVSMVEIVAFDPWNLSYFRFSLIHL